MNDGRIVSLPDDREYLDTVGLARLERSFRKWAEASPRENTRLSRRRILIIFLLIWYTGAKLNEVLALDPFNGIEFDRHAVVFGGANDADNNGREVQLYAALTREIENSIFGKELWQIRH